VEHRFTRRVWVLLRTFYLLFSILLTLYKLNLMDPSSQAVALHREGSFTALRQAALLLGVRTSTAYRRKAGLLPSRQNMVKHAKLTRTPTQVSRFVGR
jgi:hypothetical protein